MVPAVMVLVRVLCWLDFWWSWCFQWRGCWWRWFWVRVGGGPDRLGAVVGQCWVAFCVGLLLVRVSYVLVLCWVLGSLVLPTVSLLVPGVSAGEGVVASGLGVDRQCWCGCRSAWSWGWAWPFGCCWVWPFATPVCGLGGSTFVS